MTYTRFTVSAFMPDGPDTVFKGVIDPDAMLHDAITIRFGSFYLLVPEEDVERAFMSLQDAGEAAGVEPGRNIVAYLETQRLYVMALEAAIGEAMQTFRAQSNAVACQKLEDVLDDKLDWGLTR